MKTVIVKYLFGGTISENENETGILFPNGLVFVAKNQCGLYEAKPTGDNEVLVDLDTNPVDHLQEEGSYNIIELITA